ADVSARAAAKVELRNPGRRVLAKAGELALEDGSAAVILVAQVDIDVIDTDRPRRHEGALQEAVRIALEVIPVLERAGLALVDVDRHQARRRFRRDDLPLASGGEARAAEAAKPGVFHQRDDVRRRSLAAGARCGKRVAAVRAIRLVIDAGWRHEHVGPGMRDGP